VTIPLPAGVYDLICSVAALQHVPKAYVYNLFFEMKRLLKPGGYVVINLLSWNQFAHQQMLIPWWDEITSQVELRETHRHHFYGKEELEAVLKIGTGLDSSRLGTGWCVVLRRRPRAAGNRQALAATGYRKLNPNITCCGRRTTLC
jgi:SAM-dependent methyltransferase